jgi:hypothetical protein
MSQKAELLDLLAHLPEVDTVDKRKAFIGFIGFAHIGIYLDWEGANVVFSSRLVEELSRRGQATLVKFLETLPGAPQVDVRRKEQVAALRGAIQALGQAAWETEFGLVPAAAKPAQAADNDMLALTVVSTMLVPHFKGPEGARSEAVAGIVERLEQALGPDSSAAAIWMSFKAAPEALEAAMVPILKLKLAADEALASELADLVDAATRPSAPGERLEVNVLQEIRLIEGTVVGTAIGSDVIDGIVSVTQKVDKLGPGGSLTGATIGSL